MIVCLHRKPSGSYCSKRAKVTVPSIKVPVAGVEVQLQLCWVHARCKYVRKVKHEKIEQMREASK